MFSSQSVTTVVARERRVPAVPGREVLASDARREAVSVVPALDAGRDVWAPLPRRDCMGPLREARRDPSSEAPARETGRDPARDTGLDVARDGASDVAADVRPEGVVPAVDGRRDAAGVLPLDTTVFLDVSALKSMPYLPGIPSRADQSHDRTSGLSTLRLHEACTHASCTTVNNLPSLMRPDGDARVSLS